METKEITINCILLAAGASSRFGANKLLTPLLGKPLLCYTIEALPLEMLNQTVLVAHDEDVLKIANEYGIKTVFNKNYKEGINTSIKAGLDFVGEADGYMFSVCDQPLRKKSSVKRLIQTFYNNPQNIVAQSFCGVRGNPIIFPNLFKDDLKGLDRNKGGGYVASKNADRLILCEADSRVEMLDVDSQDDFLIIEGELLKS